MSALPLLIIDTDALFYLHTIGYLPALQFMNHAGGVVWQLDWSVALKVIHLAGAKKTGPDGPASM